MRSSTRPMQIATERDETARPTLHRAAWLVMNANGPPVMNGAVLTRGGVILAAGPHEAVKSQCPAGTDCVDHGSAALLPALVNAHTHLELTPLRGRIELPAQSFPDWLNQLLPLRMTLNPSLQRVGVLEGARLMMESGVALYGDVTNGASLAQTANDRLSGRIAFVEALGFDCDSLEQALGPETYQAMERASQAGYDTVCAGGHSCYSVSQQVLREAKEWCRAKNLTFSIHTAEHPEEIEFLRDGSGFCRELLERLGRRTSHWTAPGKTPVAYFESLGILDSRTLLVHAVHMTEADWEMAARNGCAVCFCPRSNRNLNVGRPDVEKALSSGLVVALGTDSLAGVEDLDLFAEGAFVLDQYTGLRPETVLAMMTAGGAAALQQSRFYGSIEPGKRSFILSVTLPDPLHRSQLAETVIRQGQRGAWQWANHPEID